MTCRLLAGCLVALLCASAGTAVAQPAAPAEPNEGSLSAAWRKERAHLADDCSALRSLAMCAYTLITASPVHVALGNLPSQNGFGIGGAFSHRTNTEGWRLRIGADAVRAFGGSWRSGASLTLVRSRDLGIVVDRDPGSDVDAGTDIRPRAAPVIDIAWQTISLRQVSFYGLGPQALESDRTVFGERQTSLGVTGIYPLRQPISLVGGVAGRWIDIRPGQPDDGPSIETRFDEATAPGLTSQDAFLELHGGVRLRPSFGNGRLALQYELRAQHFRTAATATTGPFTRWTLDLGHQIPIYRRVGSTGPAHDKGPNDCRVTDADVTCPPIRWSRNRTGTITLRALTSFASAGGGRQVPFYLQRTLGGSDLDGERLLAGLDDYRYRAPHLLVFQEGIEHSLWGPIGLFFQAEQGTVGLRRGDLGDDFIASATAGITILAGGAPAVVLAFAWSAEGRHALATMDAMLLGGGRRPSLY